MKRLKFLLAIMIAVLVFNVFIFFGTFTAHAEELPQTEQEPQTTEVIEEEPKEEEQEPIATTEAITDETTEEKQEEEIFTEEEKSKIAEIVDFIASLDKEELMELLGQAKNWFVGIGIVGVITILTALISLVAAVVKLHNEKIKNSKLSEENKQAAIESANKFMKLVEDKNGELKMLLLEFVNNLSDEEKKQVQNNVDTIKSKLIEAMNENKKED
ncbi:MAG: hypothetical protein IKP07_03545 [Bacilli bacterium]|nr:hypothetical protein [Bacilli bacterium]